MLLVGDSDEKKKLMTSISPLIGEKILPLKLKVQVFGDEAELLVYNTFTGEQLLRKAADMTGLERATMKVKAVVDSRTKRLDNKPATELSKSLADLELTHNVSVIVDLKDEEDLADEVAKQESPVQVVQAEKAAEAFEDINESPSMRTCITSSVE